MTTPRILVVDDDPELRSLIGSFLAGNGLDVEEASDGPSMDLALSRRRFDAIILDLMMPGEDGLAILRRLRGPERPKIIMLSAMGEDTDRIVGLEVGADDYLAKPCNPRELLARVRAVLRRNDGEPAMPDLRCFGPWKLDMVERRLQRGDAPPAPLTGAEFRLLITFLDRPRRVLTRDQLVELAMGTDSDVFDRAVDVVISRLRKKLGPDDPIHTVRGEGYRFVLKAARP